MSDFMKIGGKYTDSLSTETAIGVAVDAAGRVEVVRHNELEVVPIFEVIEKRDTTDMAFTGDDAVDLTEWTSCCIMVANSLNVDITIQLYTQVAKTGTAYLKNYDGSNATITLPHFSTGGYLVTPDDVPLLNYLRFFKGVLKFATAPTTGTFTIRLLLKR